MDFVFRRDMVIDPERVCFSKSEPEDGGDVVYRASILVYAEMSVDAAMEEIVPEEVIKGTLVRRLTSEVLDGMTQGEVIIA